MSRRMTWILLLAALIAPVASGQSSLVQKDLQTKVKPKSEDRPVQSLFNDPTPEKAVWRRHDLVTILVLESSQSSVQTNTSVRKETELDVELKKFIRLKKNGKGLFGYDVLNAALPNPTPAIDFEAEYERIGSGRTGRQFRLKAALTAEVIKVLPNGNLVIEARKTRQVDDDIETMVLTGIVRPADVNKTTNTVRSQQIGRFTVRYIGEGTTYNAQKAGLLSRVVEYLWPF